MGFDESNRLQSEEGFRGDFTKGRISVYDNIIVNVQSAVS
jgi:hypothetical protein